MQHCERSLFGDFNSSEAGTVRRKVGLPSSMMRAILASTVDNSVRKKKLASERKTVHRGKNWAAIVRLHQEWIRAGGDATGRDDLKEDSSSITANGAVKRDSEAVKIDRIQGPMTRSKTKKLRLQPDLTATAFCQASSTVLNEESVR